MQDHTLQRTTRRIDFGQAGFALLTVVADPFAMSHYDRDFVFTLLDSIDDALHAKELDARERSAEVPKTAPPEAPVVQKELVYGASAVEVASIEQARENEEASQELDALLIESEPESAPPAPQDPDEAAEIAAQEAALAELQAPPASTFNRAGIFGHVYETDPGMQRRLG